LASFKCIEEIEAWQKARFLVKEIYQISKRNDFLKDIALRYQIRKAAISIMSNIAEGFERNGNKEFFQFLSIAKGSTGETRSQIYIALDQGYVDQNEFNHINASLLEIGRMINGIMQYLDRTHLKGSKYRSGNHE
jgi:four helix bundle protein